METVNYEVGNCRNYLNMQAIVGALVAQWVVHLTHTRLVPGSKQNWCKNPLVFAMIAVEQSA